MSFASILVICITVTLSIPLYFVFRTYYSNGGFRFIKNMKIKTLMTCDYRKKPILNELRITGYGRKNIYASNTSVKWYKDDVTGKMFITVSGEVDISDFEELL